MDDVHHASAATVREQLSRGQSAPAAFRAALTHVPFTDRDGWLDVVLGLDSIPDDGPALPHGCVPYLPCPVDAVLRMVDHAGISASDVFVDVGSGVGRAAALVHLLTGAATIGLEIQPALVATARELATRFEALRCDTIEGDAVRLAPTISTGSVFFLYCPFSGERLDQLLDALEPLAHTRSIRICCVDLPLPARTWVTLTSAPAGDLAIYHSTIDRSATTRPAAT